MKHQNESLVLKRGSSIKVPEAWLKQCRDWRLAEKLSLAETGALLADARERPRAYALVTVRRYLSGELVTDDMTDAFAKAMRVPYPVQVIETSKQRRWCDLGTRLDKGNRKAFEAELRRLEYLVELVETLRELEEE